jgi:nucleotide-binding universal stress UspA family protein
MKTLLLSTDFSANATHAADYGYRLARQLRADMVLCNAVIVPAEVPQTGMVTWPMEEYDIMQRESKEELQQLKTRLEHENFEEGFKPDISYLNEPGTVIDVVNSAVASQKIDMVVMGTHGAGGLNQFILGDHSRNMIDNANKPLLLVPPSARIAPVKKIAFATDFKQQEDDLKSIFELIPFAKSLNADILITHVYKEEYQTPEFRKWLKDFLIELSNKADYPHIYYRLIKHANTEAGLGWLCGHGQIDMLAMFHRQHSFFDNLLNKSHTKKMAGVIPVPLLVIPRK